jgi:ubiquinone/menaquinone biosynthesis C-methylase UbiE
VSATQDSPPAQAAVERLFSQPERYLGKDAHVVMRQEVIASLAGPAQGLRLLDLGCGDGRLSLQFLPAAAQVTLVDLSAAMLALARQAIPAGHAGRVELVQSALEDYTPGCEYDVVLCVGVLAHVPGVAAAVRQVAGLATPGGRVILQLTDCDTWSGSVVEWFYRRAYAGGQGYAMNRLTYGGINRLAESVGLRLEARRRYWPLLPGMGRLPNPWLLAFQRATLDRGWMSGGAAENILLYRRAS